jgi:deoxyguanosine kinase
MTFIAIEGVIGVGKTTLARYLHEALGASLVLEVFEENPFLSSFYQDRDRYAFQTQMFFLLSRHQQMRNLAAMPRPIVSDYMFAKDQLFARQTIRGDELMMYERVYAALSENTITPDLVVYLRADTPTLMHRIEVRDRPYERGMDENYIDGLRVAYENFFAHYDPKRLLRVDTNNLDVVHHEDDRHEVIQRVLSHLGTIPQQQALPGLEFEDTGTIEVPSVPVPESTLPEKIEPQRDRTLDLLIHLTTLQAESGNLAQGIRQQWMGQDRHDQLRRQVAGVMGALLDIADTLGMEMDAADLAEMAASHQHRAALS